MLSLESLALIVAEIGVFIWTMLMKNINIEKGVLLLSVTSV